MKNAPRACLQCLKTMQVIHYYLKFSHSLEIKRLKKKGEEQDYMNNKQKRINTLSGSRDYYSTGNESSSIIQKIIKVKTDAKEHNPIILYELSILIVFAYFAYVFAELFGFSGIMSLFCSGCVHGHYRY